MTLYDAECAGAEDARERERAVAAIRGAIDHAIVVDDVSLSDPADRVCLVFEQLELDEIRTLMEPMLEAASPHALDVFRRAFRHGGVS